MGQIIRHPAVSGLAAPTPLTDSHEIDQFDCGKPPLNDWLKVRALKNEGRSSRCYVVCDGRSVVGYYCLATGSVVHSGAPRALRANLPNPTPVMVMGRLAVDRLYQRKGIGKGMLKDALIRSLQASRIVGARALIVHAVDEEAVPFYVGFDFKHFPTDMRTLYLPLDVVQSNLP